MNLVLDEVGKMGLAPSRLVVQLPRQRPSQRLHDAEEFGYLSMAFLARSDNSASVGMLLLRKFCRSTGMLAAPLGRFRSGFRMFGDQAAREFRERAHHGKHDTLA